ncbi:cytochrome b [Cognatiyoonia sp. IB215182]|uniref:cytochrome b n=1 Tax=Cognatiyoonia sp. IB215182 TaxID=3097353 RepID=UPI002A109A89|nr:cytochrome b/b6 domain-containing protein [Cognatiyoonia sp. IB215182]MDX8355022.1 cytochrome b/b6 domain-containing protein [Cognatiyoonia sp. IB215182]
MNERYPWVLRFLHWLTAAFVLAQVVLVGLNVLLYEPRPVLSEALVQSHIALGAVIFLVTICRLLIRAGSRVAPMTARPRARVTARLVHLAIYGCLLALPVTGYLQLSALGFTVSIAGLIELPPLELNVSLARAAEFWHTAFAVVGVALVLLHIVAALVVRGTFAKRRVQNMS